VVAFAEVAEACAAAQQTVALHAATISHLEEDNSSLAESQQQLQQQLSSAEQALTARQAEHDQQVTVRGCPSGTPG